MDMSNGCDTVKTQKRRIYIRRCKTLSKQSTDVHKYDKNLTIKILVFTF